MAKRYYIETLGCPKNQVDSDKLAGTLMGKGYVASEQISDADLVVVNTCAFIEAAREESIEAILIASESKQPDARLVVTGCLAARAGEELAGSMPEIDLVVDFGVPIDLVTTARFVQKNEVPAMDLLELARPTTDLPWAYVKIAEGCDRACGFCAIPSFRGPQRSRTVQAILNEVDLLGAKEIVLVAQDLASYGRDIDGKLRLTELVKEVAHRADRVRLLYLYPSSLTDELIDTIAESGLAYYDLSLQHVSRPLVRKMRRFGETGRFLERIDRIRQSAPDAALRSSFILGYPGETEEDQDALLAFIEEAQLDWAGFFGFSKEQGTYAASLQDEVPRELALERLRECSELQESITASKRQSLVGTTTEVLVDARGIARSRREAPEIDGIISVPDELVPGTFVTVEIVTAQGPDLTAIAIPEQNFQDHKVALVGPKA